VIEMRAAIWITLLALIGVWMIVAFATVDHSTDQAKVAALIARGIAATQDRDLTTLVSCISSNYKDETLKYDQLRWALGQAFGNETSFTVSTSTPDIRITGDRATVKMHVTLKHTPGNGTFYDRTPTLLLAKEDDHHMLVAPEKVWRVVGSKDMGLGVIGGTGI
jgi:hypothetical protein